jgi:polyphosphate kinase
MITLSRIDAQSKLAESLIRAAENGKEVIVLMELRARFDEANNIEWSRRLDEAGCRVIYGPSGYKVHSKICLITRREFGGIQRITQIGTGNYNEKTVRQYTDLSLVTTNREIGRDAAAFFNNLLLGNVDEDYALLWAAPRSFKTNILRRIEQERHKAENGETGRIIIKCNSLTDKDVIEKMIEASRSGVKISLIVRGACCLLPRIPGLTENITVIGIVGRFLEHSRIFCFGVGADRELYISSADLMTRNTERRIEIACPVLDADLKRRICEMLETLLADNTKAWELFSNGRYVLRRSTEDPAVDSQDMFTEQARVLAARVAAESEQNAKNASFSSSVSRAEKGLRGFVSKFR